MAGCGDTQPPYQLFRSRLGGCAAASCGTPDDLPARTNGIASLFQSHSRSVVDYRRYGQRGLAFTSDSRPAGDVRFCVLSAERCNGETGPYEAWRETLARLVVRSENRHRYFDWFD